MLRPNYQRTSKRLIFSLDNNELSLGLVFYEVLIDGTTLLTPLQPEQIRNC